MFPGYSHSASRKNRIPLFLIVFFLVLASVSFSLPDDDHFFSFQRLRLRPALTQEILSAGKAQEELARFASYYQKGLVLYSEGKPEKAERSFMSARKAWPEYFYTDFLIALILDDRGDYAKSARFYKSYLNKLNEYHKGNYRISGPLISSFSSGRIESYDIAYTAVDARLAGYGINIRKVRPVHSPPFFLIPIVTVLSFAGFYFMLFYVLAPLIRKKQREKNPPEGFWTCPNCGEYSPELARECVSCGRERKTKDHG
jgi:tetratricopeptide (TPR) repeat protein